MKEPTSGAWISLNASYYVEPACHPDKLLDDANLFLDGAHGIIRSLSESLSQDMDIDPDDLANALWGAAMLLQMGQRSAQEAHGRLQKANLRDCTRFSPSPVPRD
jgi:hypothetical protein